MSEQRKALLLIGSPKPQNSTSESLGRYLTDRLHEKDIETESMHICSELRTEEGQGRLLLGVGEADIIILSFPLYVDSLPAGVTRALEMIAESRKRKVPHAVAEALRKVVDLAEQHSLFLAIGLIVWLLSSWAKFLPPIIIRALDIIGKSQKVPGLKQTKAPIHNIRIVKNFLDGLEPKRRMFVAISNSGFPEAHQSNTALAICRKFADEAELDWAGGLALGGGAAIDGKPLDKTGGMTRNVRKSLDIAAQDIAAGHPISQQAIDLMAKPISHTWLYILLGNIGWLIQMWRNRKGKRLGDGC